MRVTKLSKGPAGGGGIEIASHGDETYTPRLESIVFGKLNSYPGRTGLC